MPATRLHLPEVDAALAAALAAIPVELGVASSFPPAVEAEAKAIATSVTLPDRDRTEIPFVTIDPSGSTDLDQALHLAREGAGYRVLYAIADVPAFVRPGGAIDTEARRRGQTVYAPQGRIPLHPTVLSEGAASLLPGELRGAFVWDFLLDAECHVVEVTVYPARVRSREKLDYQSVQRSIDDGTASEVLQLLREVGVRRLALEHERGGASLGTQETEIVVVPGGYALERRASLAVEDWNAQLSLMTGMAAARMMLDGGVGILRTMPPPSDEAVQRFRSQAATLGTPWPDDERYGDYLRRLDTSDRQQLAIMHAAASLFRGAGYAAFDGEPPEQTVQAAVAAPYTHVTAPLRRLVDRFALVVCAALSAGQPVPEWARAALPELPGIMASTGSTTGQVESQSLNVVEAAVLAAHVGEVFEATVLAAGEGRGTIQLIEPAVTARCTGTISAGQLVRARLVTAEVSTGTVEFTVDEEQNRE